MSFIRPISQYSRHGLACIRVDVPLTVFDDAGRARTRKFVYDTGCEITMVSEDVAHALGLPPDDGTRQVRTVGATGGGSGRLVDVRFRFPDTVSGKPGLEVSSTWVVVTGQTQLALLGFQEVHRHFSVRTDQFLAFFITWASLRGE